MSDEEKVARERNDVEWIMSTEQGRRFMWRLLGECKVFHDFEGDTNQILKQVGRRQIGLFLSGVLTDAAEDAFFRMQLEAKNRTIEEIRNDNSINTSTDYPDGTCDSGLPEYDTSGSLASYI